LAKGAVTETVYQFVKDYIKKNTHPPTLREIADGCYLTPTAVTRYLERLEGEGKLKRKPGIPRGITLTNDD
jgi:DNA-binding MarR family transcriptional regulator